MARDARPTRRSSRCTARSRVPRIDALATFKTVLMGGVFLCMLAYVVVRRHTRSEERRAGSSCSAAGVVGRRAPLAAAVLLATAARARHDGRSPRSVRSPWGSTPAARWPSGCRGR